MLRGTSMQICLITGRPGVGKTTLTRNIAESIGFERCAGFYTVEIRKGATRTGFEWRTFDGNSGILANLESGQPRVGKYHVVLDSFESMLEDLRSIAPDKVLLVDEVGKMECLSAKFRDLLLQWEKTNNFRIFTVAQRGTPFIESFKVSHSMQILELTFSNREQIKKNLVRLLL
jgi:nucleoside-triphosphatase